MRNPGNYIILVLLILATDWYVFSAIRTITAGLSDRARMLVHSGYWLITLLAIATMIALPLVPALAANKILRNYVFAIFIGLFFAKLIAAAFFLLDDLRRLATWISLRVAGSNATTSWDDVQIQRSVFLTWLGTGLGALLFGSLLWGFRNKYNYQLKKLTLHFPNLPTDFNGFTLVHISDVHSGSFQNPGAVRKGIDLINGQKPDVILFTGDLVNDKASEMDEYKSIFAQLSAPMGVYSTLGNHDYGDYVAWETPAAKRQNLETLKATQAEMGWKLLMNEHKVLSRGNARIALLGIENWGAKGRFPKYGKMDLAHAGTENIPFKILLSHDPSHWDAQVRTEYPDVDLMLSGHTHGMQFGSTNPYFRFSPVQWLYKQWAGLYEEGTQKLYVNPGFGFIGYPGRVGILPEITVIELRSGQA